MERIATITANTAHPEALALIRDVVESENRELHVDTVHNDGNINYCVMSP